MLYRFLGFVLGASVVLVIAWFAFDYMQNPLMVGENNNFPKVQKQEKNTATITFVGDIMLDRHIRSKGNENGYDSIFEYIKSELEQSDLAVANLEGPVTTNPSRSIGSIAGDDNNYTFTFAPIALKAMANANIKMVTIGNNHIMNFGKDGLLQTEKFLNRENIKYFGDPLSSANYETTTINGISIAFVPYNQFLGEGSDKTVSEIKTLRDSNDFVFVYAHWGDEYKKEPNDLQKELAHKFIDSGADAVLGSHPHVVEESETYKGKPIYYSLGNFVFDQYFSEDVRCGAMATFILKKDKSLKPEISYSYLETDGTTRPGTCGESARI